MGGGGCEKWAEWRGGGGKVVEGGGERKWVEGGGGELRVGRMEERGEGKGVIGIELHYKSESS